MYRTKFRWIAPALVLALGVVACDEGTAPETPETSLTVLLTDDPGDVAAVWVQILGMHFQGDEEVLDPPLDAPGWIDLLQYKDDYFGLVTGVDMPEGEYQLRLVLGDHAVLVVEGEEGTPPNLFVMGNPWAADPLPEDFPTELAALEPEGEFGVLHCPSCTQSGLKVIPIEDEISIEGEEETLVVDFDVAESFGKEAGGSGRWVMRPVLRQVVDEAPADVPQGG
jgi:hypothetical protein